MLLKQNFCTLPAGGFKLLPHSIVCHLARDIIAVFLESPAPPPRYNPRLFTFSFTFTLFPTAKLQHFFDIHKLVNIIFDKKMKDILREAKQVC